MTDIAASLYDQAELHESVGEYAKAEALYHQVVDIDLKALGKEHPNYATDLNALALLYTRMGSYAAAEPLYKQALEIYRMALGEEHPYFANGWNNLAGLYESMGNYAEAVRLYRRALRITRAAVGEEDPAFATVLNNLAFAYESIGTYDRATPLYRRALDIRRKTLGEEHPDFADSCNNLAGVYQAGAKNAEAELLYRKALAVRRKAFGREHPEVAQSLNNLASLYKALGRYPRAKALYGRALAIRRSVLGEDHPQLAAGLNNLAGLYMATGNYAKAQPLYRRALKIARAAFGEEHPLVAGTLNNLASLRVATHRKAEAMKLMNKAVAIEDRMIGQIFSLGSESQRMAYLRMLRGSLESFLSLVAGYVSPPAAARQAAFGLVLRRKGIGAEALAAQRDAVLGNRYPALKPRLREWTTLRVQIARKTLDGPGSEDFEAHRRLLAEWNAQKESLEEELARQIPEMNLEQQLKDADRHAVAGALPEGAALVEFVRFEVFDFKAVPARGESEWKSARYLAFVLHSRKPNDVRMIDLGAAEPIDQKVASFRASITGEGEPDGGRSIEPTSTEPERVSVRSDRAALREALVITTRHARPSSSIDRDSDDARRLGFALREALFDPLLPALDGRKHLFLAPDGDLARLPFEVLPDTDGGHLVDEYRISYLGVGRDVLRFEAKSTRRPGPPVVVADPDFDLGDAEGRRFSDQKAPFGHLKGTRAEGEQVSALLRAEPLLEAQALETIVKGHRSPHVLHVASHGFFLPNAHREPNKERLALGSIESPGYGLLAARLGHAENPLLRSGLALAGANTWFEGGKTPEEAEDGLLTAEDVTGMDLLATEIVVLSACETGLGEVHMGEGVYGLRRAFMLAGAKSLVMSLWKVPDEQTKELMEDFYQRLLEGQPRAEALREAQLAMKAKYPDPLYWGAFICQGAPSSLPI